MICKKQKKSIFAIYIIVMVLYSLLFLIIPFSKKIISWIMFIFSIISLIFGLFVTLNAFNKRETLLSKFFGFPVFRIGIIYTIAQIIISIIVFIFSTFVNIQWWIGFSISIILLGLALASVILIDNSRDYIESIDLKENSDTKAMKSINSEIINILDLCDNEIVKEKLKKLAKKFSYSDPISSSETKKEEIEIQDEVKKLKEIINNEECSKVIKQIEIISNLLNNRNRICENKK